MTYTELPAGNYPFPVWNDVTAGIVSGNARNFRKVIEQGLMPGKGSRIFITADICGFTALSNELRDDIPNLKSFLEAFFIVSPEHGVESKNVRLLKFLGDGWLSDMPDDICSALSLAWSAIRVFNSEILSSLPSSLCEKNRFVKPGLTVSIARADTFLEGFVASENYVDWTVYGAGINSLFKALKYRSKDRKEDLRGAITLPRDLWNRSLAEGFELTAVSVEPPDLQSFRLDTDDDTEWLRLRVTERDEGELFTLR